LEDRFSVSRAIIFTICKEIRGSCHTEGVLAAVLVETNVLTAPVEHLVEELVELLLQSLLLLLEGLVGIGRLSLFLLYRILGFTFWISVLVYFHLATMIINELGDLLLGLLLFVTLGFHICFDLN